MAYVPHHNTDYKNSVRVASTGNINLSAPGSSIDGVTLSSGNRFLAKNQTTASENGIYIFNGAASTATRSTDADTGSEINSGMVVIVEEGTINADKTFSLTTNDPITIGVTSLSFSENGSANYAMVKAVRTTAQSISSGSPETLLLFDSEEFDTASMHSTVTNTSRIVAQESGTFEVSVGVNFAANSTGTRYFSVRKNAAGSPSGGTFLFADTRNAASSPTSTVITGSSLVNLNAGDYIEVFAYQSSGASLNVDAAGTFVSMVKAPTSYSYTTATSPIETCIWRQGALVTLTGTTSLIFADNGAVATFNSSAGYRGITRINPDHFISPGKQCQIRAVLNYATVTSPSAKIGCSIYPVSSISSGVLTVGSALTTSETVSSAGANEAGAVETPWVTISSPTFLAAMFEWKSASGASNTYGDMRIEVRQI